MYDRPGQRIPAAGRDRIGAFIADYRIAADDRAPTASERQLIADALVEYLFAEEWLMSPPGQRAATALRALTALKRHVPPITRPSITLVEHCVAELASRLTRREDANLIMREDCVMLSETIRQLRGATT